ncbi:OsmC family protein [Vibrio sp. OCN044]|uniref:OsmC family protein n=1 Tax=Vibrio tetraodonis subsp. pristinus TaxID=2695891 RepID=A0A6L8LSE3_9VIBR|nr:OsmC family protein [Vibrio tetraodonis]MYM59011.1 OsmC family protein [Vibrio tetraodonis subsp. pristinus]
MKAEVKWLEDLKFVGKTDKKQEIIFGAGDSALVSPMEMVLMAAGGCSSVDVVDGLKQLGQRVSTCSAKLTTERRDTAPRIFTKVNIHFEISGDGLDTDIVEKVTADSLQKYCSVCLMLGAGVEMTHSWEVI